MGRKKLVNKKDLDVVGDVFGFRLYADNKKYSENFELFQFHGLNDDNEEMYEKVTYADRSYIHDLVETAKFARYKIKDCD